MEKIAARYYKGRDRKAPAYLPSKSVGTELSLGIS
jgi:hypothetical protein